MSGRVGGQDKASLRATLLAARRLLTPADRAAAAEAIRAQALGWDALSSARIVAAYVSVGSEPGTLPLLEALLSAGTRVLLPVVLPDNDLDWASYSGPGSTMSAARGLQEPTGARLGVDAVRTADMVLVPGLAASPTGDRLGRGGGSYDRALARVAPGTPVVVVLYDDEVGLAVPIEPHDRPVSHALTPSGVVAISRRSQGPG